MRKIIHVDMDAFYASIEQRDNPHLRGKPLAVGFSAQRGVVAAASYEARKYGVRSAMPSKTALARCPHLLFTPARFDVYREVSLQIRRIFLSFTDLVEPLSLDEAYLDVTENHYGVTSATRIAREIKRRIRQATGLTASAGVSVNKFLAKIASDYDKPDGLYVIKPEDAEAFVEGLKIEQFWGVGRVTAEKMHSLGIHTGADLKQFGEADLVRYFGKAGHTYYQNARAIDERTVEPDRERKSIGAETTFSEDVGDRAELSRILGEIAEEVWARTTKRGIFGRTVTLKIKYEDFELITRRRTLLTPVSEFGQLVSVAGELLGLIGTDHKKIRLIGLILSSLQDASEPLFRQLEIDYGDWENAR